MRSTLIPRPQTMKPKVSQPDTLHPSFKTLGWRMVRWVVASLVQMNPEPQLSEPETQNPEPERLMSRPGVETGLQECLPWVGGCSGGVWLRGTPPRQLAACPAAWLRVRVLGCRVLGVGCVAKGEELQDREVERGLTEHFFDRCWHVLVCLVLWGKCLAIFVYS